MNSDYIRNIVLGLVVIVMLVLAGCAAQGTTQVSQADVVDTARGAKPEATPFILEIVDEANDGQRLLIKGRLRAKQEWSAQEVVLRLTALDESGSQRTLLHRLDELLPSVKFVAPQEPAEFTLAVASAGLSNYQLEVLWGNEAATLTKQTKSPVATESNPAGPQELVLRGLEVHRLPDASCASPDECIVKFTITGEFFNSGAAIISHVILKAGFSTADKLDLSDQILENERQVEVQNLKLAPGGTKPFRMVLETKVVPTQQMAPRPVIRIVSVKTE
jgi:hypothetical protein